MLGVGQLADQLLGLDVVDQGAQRHRHQHFIGADAAAVGAAAILAALGAEHPVEAEIRQGIQVDVGHRIDIAAVAAVAAVGAAERNGALAAEADTAVAAVAGFDTDGSFVNEFHYGTSLSKLSDIHVGTARTNKNTNKK